MHVLASHRGTCGWVTVLPGHVRCRCAMKAFCQNGRWNQDFTRRLEYLGPARFGRIMKSLYLDFDTDDRPHQLGWQWVARRWTTAYKCIATTPMQSARKATPGFSISIMTFLEGFWGLLGMFWCFWCSRQSFLADFGHQKASSIMAQCVWWSSIATKEYTYITKQAFEKNIWGVPAWVNVWELFLLAQDMWVLANFH